MARKARRAKKQQPDSAAETLNEIESLGDRIVEWIGENPYVILGTALGILVLVGAIALTADYQADSRIEAAASLATVRGDYRRDMGASPGSVEIPEPANAETAKTVRREYVDKFVAVAEEYEGSTAAALALLEAGTLQQELDENEAAIATFGRALAEVPKGDPVRPFLHLGVAAVYEENEAWGEAAAAYRAAADVADFPLRWDALSDAARCYAQAGDRSQALSAFEQIESDAPNFRMPPYLKARYSELKATAASE